MLNSAFSNDLRWNRLQEPARPSGKSADLMRLLAALDTGWLIFSPVRLLPCEDAFGGQVFSITLYHHVAQELRELQLVRTESVERFLKDENIPVTQGKNAGH